jgi:hypothetical protein
MASEGVLCMNYEFGRPTTRIIFNISAKYRDELNQLINDFSKYIEMNF